MAENGHRSDISVSILYDESSTGVSWKTFIESLFVESLPEEHKDLNVDIGCESLNNITEEALHRVKYSQWRLLLLTAEMIEMIQNPQYKINETNIMQTSTGGLIILLVGNNNDMGYQRKSLECLHGFSDYFDFELVRVKFTEQIFRDILGILSPINIAPHPNTISYEDSQQCITFLSNKPYKRDKSVKYIFEFINSSGDSKSAQGIFYNPYTMLVESTGHTAGTLVVKAYVCILNENNEEISQTQIGKDMKIWLQSDLDKFHSILERQDCVEFLSQAMQIHANDQSNALEHLDKVLLDSIKRNVPAHKLGIVFGNDQGLDVEQDIKSDQHVPTLLHFSAMYGLRDVTSFLLQCPGSLRAFGTANYDGDFPTTLAEKYGHWDLKEFMTNYMQVSAMVDDEYGGKNQTPEIMSNLVSGTYLTFDSEGDNDYKPIENSEIPAYLPMRGLNSPMIIPIDEEDDQLYSNIIKNLIEGNESLYETLTHPKPELSPRQPYSPSPSVSLDVGREQPPPLPPPRESIDHTTTKQISSYNEISIPNLPSMSSPAQQELINLQCKVKNNELTINQAVLRFREWGKNHKERAASFQYQQERLQKIRVSITRRQNEKTALGQKASLKISQPVAVGSSTYGRILYKTSKDGASNDYSSLPKNNSKKTSSWGQQSIDLRDDLSSLYGSSTVLHRLVTEMKDSTDNAPPLPPRDDKYVSRRPPPGVPSYY